MKKPILLLIVALAYIQCLHAQNWNEKLKAVASDRAAGDQFGWSVSISGDYAIVGAMNNNTNAVGSDSIYRAGAAYIFEQDNNGNWVQKQKIVASDRIKQNSFGCSVSISGNYAIVGARTNNSAYLFERNTSGIWEQKQKITSFDSTANDGVGQSVSISGRYAIVGAKYNNTNALEEDTIMYSGAAYLFERDSKGTWIQKQKIVASIRDTGDCFGSSVSISNNYAIIGASYSTHGARPDGSAYIFEMENGILVEKERIVKGRISSFVQFGISVAISGNYAIVGGDSVPYIYERDSSGTWQEKQKITPSDEKAFIVGISGNYALVGFGGNSKNATGTDSLKNAGAAFLFKRDVNGNWVQQKKIVASDRTSGALFGSVDLLPFASNGIAISGNHILIGSIGNTTNATGKDTLTRAGAAYFFEPCVPVTSSQTPKICAGDSVTVGANTYKKTGTYTNVLTTVRGCDSTITTKLTVLPVNATTQTRSICEGDSVVIGTTSFKVTGTYTLVLSDANSCDSSITLHLTVNKKSASTLTKTACNSYTLNGITYNTSGTYMQKRTNAAGCDSTIILNLTINKSSSASITQTACENYVFNNKTYTTSGTYTQTLTNAAGCDSIITLDLTIKKSSIATITQTACDSYTLNNQTYTSSGTYTQTLSNAVGCDSTITLNLTINKSSSATISQTACDNYVLNNKTYTASGTYTQTLTNAAGCDSTITLNLNINKSSNATISQTACDSYVFNNKTYTSSGTYTQTLSNAAGCDSTLTLNLSINKVDATLTQNGMTLTANAINAHYQWIDCINNNAPLADTIQSYTAAISGIYAVVITQNNCSDTSDCYLVTDVGIEQNNHSVAQQLHIFPNPNNGAFTIKAFEEGMYSIVNTLGKAVQTFKLNAANNYTISIDNLSDGMYFIIGQNKHGFVSRKVIVAE